MGIVIGFPDHQTRASAGLKPNTARSACSPSRDSSSENVAKCSDGMNFRVFQLETAGRETRARVAAADVPPTASMTASTELSIRLDTSRNVNLSSLENSRIVNLLSFHKMAVDFRRAGGFCKRVRQTKKMIAARLVETRKALDLSAADICRRIGCTANRWSQYESGTSKRTITRPVAERLCDEFGLTLDWIYRGNPTGLPYGIALKLKSPAA
jgi:hypothetical protein